MPHRILVVEDDDSVRRSLVETLTEEGFDVASAPDGTAAVSLLGRLRPDLVLSDVRMPGMDGLELLGLVKERAPGTDVVLMTAYDDMATVARAMREGAFDFVVKPLRPERLDEVVTRVFTDRRARQRHREAARSEARAYSLDTLVGRDPAMVQVFKRVGQLAARRVSVLLRGETGSGKGVVARAIHYNSPDADEPFVAVNCTSLPESLLESELFGHVRGAFTGAVADRRGRFALAGRGTIFLDEVGDTSPSFQAKILRVLEEGEYFPVGAEGAEHTEARIVAATHRPLESLIHEGEFRQDLYYRLRVVEIRIPPLRDRPGDIPLLAAHFLARAEEELHRPGLAFSEEAEHALLLHPWPGNVRELENAVTRAAVVAPGSVIRPEHLGLGAAVRTSAPGQGGDGDPTSTDGLPDPKRFPTLEEMEGRHLKRALAVAEGNRTRAADLLGVSKPRLYRMLERHGLR